ncbi:MAG TPA: hypothetical protein VHY76_11035 [Acetobacteraceae bacterium]|jgi:hypothetical protein|nr:hypothetical protein [Acetobacteraceae bacterium]
MPPAPSCIGLIAACVLASAAHAQTLHARQGETITLGTMSASVYFDDSGGDFRVTTTVADGYASTPVRFVASLGLGQVVLISVPLSVGHPARQVRLMRTSDGLDVAYLPLTIN